MLYAMKFFSLFVWNRESFVYTFAHQITKTHTVMKQINHKEYMKKVKTLTNESLRYIIQDCQEALTAMPNCEKAGYYQDEIHYCAMELSRRASTK